MKISTKQVAAKGGSKWAGWAGSAWSVMLGLLLLLGQFSTAHGVTPMPGQTVFLATEVGQSSTPVVVTVTVASAGTAGVPQLRTEGIADPGVAEFTLSDAGTCGSTALAVGQSCTVSVVFAPRFPGMRHGAVLLQSSGGTLLASALLSGVGQGSLPVLIPGQISTVAGNGQWFYQGDGVPATQSPIYLPSGLAVDGAGNLYLADTINNRVRRVDATTQVISTVAGNGSPGSAGDGGPATAAGVTNPTGLAMDGAGNLYIADTGNHAIRRVDAVTGIITTVAGVPGSSGYSGDGGAATSALLNSPQGIAVTPSGDLVIADTSNAVLRVVTARDGRIQTVAGTGAPGFNGDGLLATAAQLNEPTGVALRADGAIAIADLSNNRVRLMKIGDTLSTVAGTGTLGYSGDGGPATQAALQEPAAVAFDPAGDLLIADSVNNCLRLVYGSQGTIMTLAGTPTDDRFYGDGGPANEARMHGPEALYFGAGGDLWVADRFNNRVREISGSQLTVGPYPTMKVGKVSQPVAEQMINAGNETLTLNSPGLQQATLDGASTTCGQAGLAASSFCTMGLEFAPTTVGTSINGSVTWTSNAPNVTPVDDLYGQVLDVEPTSTVLTADANPALLGQPVTLTATVTSDDKGRTGTVDFVEGSTTWCSARPVGTNGTAVCQVPGLSLGTHSFVGNYSGDNNNAASVSPVLQVTVKQKAALALNASPNPATVTNSVALTFTATDATGVPTGTVVLYDGAVALATVSLNSQGQAVWSSSSFQVGQHALTAQYSGDGANLPETTSAVAFEVDQAGTATVLSATANNAVVGTTVTFTAKVVSLISQVPTGTVQLLDGTNVLSSVALDSTGSASFSVSSLTPGPHAIKAVYVGDTDDASSTSTVLAEQVQQVATVTTVGADVDPLTAGAPVQLTANVAIAPGMVADGAVTGTVTFTDGSATLGSAQLNASGQANLALKTLSVGVHQITASFSGNTNYAASRSTVLNETVQQAASTVALSATATSVLTGTAASFQTVVTSATGTPSGTVTFKDGNSVLGAVTLDANGKASFATTQLSTGVHSISAAYSGDVNYVAATSVAVQVTVSLAQPVLTLTAPGAVGTAGMTAQFTSLLVSNGLVPTGTIALLDGSTVIAAEPVPSNGKVVFSIASLSVGLHQLTASYSGDANTAPVRSPVTNFTVQPAATTTSLEASANPLTQGQSLSLSVAVTSTSPGLSGQVLVYDGATLLTSVPLGSDGHATVSSSNLGLGTHQLTAVYSGDGIHAGSTSSTVAELVVQALGLAVSSSVNPSVSGQNVTLTGHVSGSPLPTGSVSFLDGTNLLGTVPVDGTGNAAFTTNRLSVGVHALSIAYSGDVHFAATSASLSQVVQYATTTTTVSTDVNPGTYGSPMTFSILVASNGGAATGVVTLTEGGKSLGTATLDASGRAALQLATLSPGSHSIVATYAGDGKAGASNSAPLLLAVKQTTGLALASDANPAQTLSAVTLTASVTNPGAAPATGTVTFADGATVLGTAQVVAGKAVLSVAQMVAGSHSLSASYAGDGANFASQSSTLQQVVQRRATTTTVTGAGTNAANPEQITLIAVVHGSGSVPPSGTVTFTSGAVTLGTASVDATGVAAITVIFQTATQQIVASYGGDDSYALSQSSATPITAGMSAQFTVSLSRSDLTLVSHQKTTITVTVASVKGFTDDIALGCVGLPYAATCTFDNTKLKLNADGSVSASLIVDTGDPLGAGASAVNHMPHHPGVVLCFAPLGLLLGLLRRQGRWKRVPALLGVLLVLLVSAGGLAGCGGLQISGTPAGSYSFRVTATGQASNVTELQTVNLVVTQ